MIVLDRLLVGGIRFVLEKLVQAAEAERNDDSALREELLAAQMRLELGEITEEEYVATERELLAAMRELRERTRGPAAATSDLKVTGIEASFEGEEHSEAAGTPHR
jgi:Gas vesicle protein G